MNILLLALGPSLSWSSARWTPLPSSPHSQIFDAIRRARASVRLCRLQHTSEPGFKCQSVCQFVPWPAAITAAYTCPSVCAALQPPLGWPFGTHRLFRLPATSCSRECVASTDGRTSPSRSHLALSRLARGHAELRPMAVLNCLGDSV